MRSALIVLIISVGFSFFRGTVTTPKSYSDGPIEEVITLDSTQVAASTVVAGLNVPWEITWGPDNWIWFTEQGGTVSKVDPTTGHKKRLLTIPEVFRKKSYGLLGMAIHPHFKTAPYVFLDYTYLQDSTILSRLVRYTYVNDSLVNPVTLLQDIPGATYHNGCRILIAPDGKLMMSTGDAGRDKTAQDPRSLSGKILRLNIDGTIPADNPIPGSPVWSWGHRNPQGLVYASNGYLYSSEHGEANDDELNRIRKGANYGWPDVQGFCNNAAEKKYCDSTTITEPLKSWTPVIAPAGIDYYHAKAIPEWTNSILLTTLKDCSFRVLHLNQTGDAILSENVYFDKAFGRLRDICIAPNGDIYASTSNRDWNPTCEGFPQKDDDRIIRLFAVKKGTLPNGMAQLTARKANAVPEKPLSTGHTLYNQYCIACHKKDGNGFENTFPPLSQTATVLGAKKTLIGVVLQGLSGPIHVKGVAYNQSMPAFNFLADAELADILTFVRSHFGNNASPVIAADIKAVRLKNKN